MLKSKLLRSIATVAVATVGATASLCAMPAHAQSTSQSTSSKTTSQAAPAPSPSPTPAPAPIRRQGGRDSLNPADTRLFDAVGSGVDIVGNGKIFEPQMGKVSYESAYTFATCAVPNNHDRARSVLAIDAKPNALNRFLVRNRGCAVAVQKSNSELMRGALAEVIVADPGYELPKAGTPDEVMAFFKHVPLVSREIENPLNKGQLAGECRAAFAPVQAQAVLGTEVGSEEEIKALALLSAVTPQCDQFHAERQLSNIYQRVFAARGLYYWGLQGANG